MDKKVCRHKQIPAPIRNHLLKQKSSEDTIKDYCQKNGINPQTFYGWRKRYGKRLLAVTKQNDFKPQQSVTFASLGTLSTQLQRNMLFDLRFSSGTVISVYAGTSAQELAPFLELISRSNAPC